MALANRQRAGYWLVVIHFPLYGIFGYLRAEDWKALGYLIYVGPMAAYVTWTLAARMLGVRPSLPGGPLFKESQLHALLMLGFLLLMLLGLVHAAVAGGRDGFLAVAEAVLLFILSFFWLAVLDAAQKSPDGLSRILHAVFLSLILYLAMNVAAVLLGFESEGQMARYTREFGALFSPGGVRASFPLIQVGQLFAIVGGVAAVFAIHKLRSPGWGDRILGLLGAMLGLAVLVGQSARAPLLALALVLAYGLIWKRAGRFLTPLLIVSLAVVPAAFVYLDAGSYLRDVLAGMGLDLSRSQGDVASLSNRDVIWTAALNHMFLEAGLLKGLLGYGAYGHVSSGLSEQYRWLFEYSYAGLDHPTLHSSYVQTFVDYGMLGVLLLLGVLLAAVRRLRTMMLRQRRLAKDATMLTMVLLYLSICAVTEGAIGYYAWDLFAIFLFVNLYVMAQRATLQSPRPAAPLRSA